MLRIGRPDVRPDAAAHVAGVHTGHAPGALESMPGHMSDGRVTAARSTGIDPMAHGPIDPRMPNLPPA